jgi:hypothetical protein
MIFLMGFTTNLLPAHPQNMSRTHRRDFNDRDGDRFVFVFEGTGILRYGDLSILHDVRPIGRASPRFLGGSDTRL